MVLLFNALWPPFVFYADGMVSIMAWIFVPRTRRSETFAVCMLFGGVCYGVGG